ncbi:MAG: ATPase domain-containing protein [bacterium]
MTEPAQRRMLTGIPGLDQMLGGGLFEGNATLIAGAPGTGKTTAGLHFIAAGVAAGETGVLVTFEYLPQQIYRDAARRGWDLRAWEDKGLVRILCTTPDVLLAESAPGITLLDEAIRDIGAKRLVIDSMTHFEFMGHDGPRLREEMAGLMNHLRLVDVTTLITHEIPDIIGPAVRVSEYGLEFLVDSVIILRYVELEGELQKAINVLKCRGSDHDRHYRRLALTEKGMVVEALFAGIENISGGSARRSVAQRARELI